MQTVNIWEQNLKEGCFKKFSLLQTRTFFYTKCVYTTIICFFCFPLNKIKDLRDVSAAVSHSSTRWQVHTIAASFVPQRQSKINSSHLIWHQNMKDKINSFWNLQHETCLFAVQSSVTAEGISGCGFHHEYVTPAAAAAADYPSQRVVFPGQTKHLHLIVLETR